MTDEKQKHLYIEFAKYEPYFNSYFSCGDYILKYSWQQKWCRAVLSSSNNDDWSTFSQKLVYNEVKQKDYKDKNATLEFSVLDTNSCNISIMKKENGKRYSDMNFWIYNTDNYSECEDKFIKEQLTEMSKALENDKISNDDEFASEFKNWKFGIESSFGKLEEDVTTFLDNTIQSKFITEEYDNNQWFDGEMTFKEKN
jgi:hypothetical protein|tara:strand:- start:979 stop:1572 length:594 start_codon:yes stop_codon:yes gene_type:complete